MPSPRSFKHFTRDDLTKAVSQHYPGWESLVGVVPPDAVVFPIFKHQLLDDGKFVRCKLIVNFEGSVVTLYVPLATFNSLGLVPGITCS